MDVSDSCPLNQEAATSMNWRGSSVVTRRMLLHDESAFLSLETEQPWDEPVPSDWVLYMGNDPNRGPVGWTVCFDTAKESPGEVDVTFEVAPSPPPMPGAAFTDVVEVSASGVVELMEGTWETHTVAKNTIGAWSRVRLSREQPQSGPSNLLVQAWPAPPTAATVLRVVDKQPVDVWQVGLPEAEAGLAGAARIGSYVDRAPGCRPLSGELGTASASMDIPGSMNKLTNLFEVGIIRTPALDGSSSKMRGVYDADGNFWSTCYVKNADHPDRMAGTTMSGILTRPRVEHDPPRRSALWWRWGTPVPPFHDILGTPKSYEPLLAQDSLLDVRYDRNPDKTITVTLEHSLVPVEWVDDLSAWWTYQLAIVRQGRTKAATARSRG